MYGTQPRLPLLIVTDNLQLTRPKPPERINYGYAKSVNFSGRVVCDCGSRDCKQRKNICRRNSSTTSHRRDCRRLCPPRVDGQDKSLASLKGKNGTVLIFI